MRNHSDYLSPRFRRAAEQDALRLARPHTAREFRDAVNEVLAEHELIELPVLPLPTFEELYPDGWRPGDPERG